jgi:hypothetical protein
VTPHISSGSSQRGRLARPEVSAKSGSSRRIAASVASPRYAARKRLQRCGQRPRQSRRSRSRRPFSCGAPPGGVIRVVVGLRRQARPTRTASSVAAAKRTSGRPGLPPRCRQRRNERPGPVDVT